MNKFWRRLSLFIDFYAFGLTIKEAWKDSGEVVYASTRSKRA